MLKNNTRYGFPNVYIYATNNDAVYSAVRMLPPSKFFDVVVSLTKGKPLVHR